MGLRRSGEKNVKSTLQYAVWPVESLAVRRGVHLTYPSISLDKQQHRDMLLASEMDRIEKIPSSYLWDFIHSLERKSTSLQKTLQSLHLDLKLLVSSSSSNNNTKLSSLPHLTQLYSIIRSQNEAFMRIEQSIATVHNDIELTKNRIRKLIKVKSILDDPFRK